MWNVHGLKTTGKMAVIGKEVNRLELLILRISETHWYMRDKFIIDEGDFIFSSENGNYSFT